MCEAAAPRRGWRLALYEVPLLRNVLKAGGRVPTALAAPRDKKSLWDGGSNITHRSRASMRTLVMAVERHDLTAADRSGLSRAGFAGIGSLYAALDDRATALLLYSNSSDGLAVRLRGLKEATRSHL